MKNRAISAKTGLFILGGLGSLIYLSLIFNNNLWVDEAFSACIIRGDFFQMLSGTASDTLPPFYNVFTWLLTSVFGYNSYIMKLSSVIPMMLIMLWLSPCHVSRLYGGKTAALYTICVICAPHLLHYGVEIRPYSWGFFFVSAAGVFALEILASGFIGASKYYACLTGFTLLSGYTHQYALIPCAYLWLMLLIYIMRTAEGRCSALKTWFKSLAAFIVLYIPMLALTLYQLKRASTYFSMEALSLRSLMSDLRFPYVTNITPVSALLLAASVLLLAFSVATAIKDRGFIISIVLICVPYLTLAFGYLASALSRGSIFTSRYLVPSLGLFWLGISIAAVGAEGRALSPGSIPNALRFLMSKGAIGLVALTLLSLLAIYPQEFREEYASGVKRMTAYFNENLGAGDGYIIYEDKYQIELCMRYYYPSLKKYDWETAGECTGKLWYFEVPGYEEYLSEAPSYGYESEFISNMGFDRYTFSLYSLQQR